MLRDCLNAQSRSHGLESSFAALSLFGLESGVVNMTAEHAVPPAHTTFSNAHLWREARRSLWSAAVILALCAACFAGLVSQMPRFKDHELQLLVSNFPPKNLQSVINMRDCLLNYASTYPVIVSVAMYTLYIIMQTFAIPGTVTLSLMSGALHGTLPGLALVSFVSTMGSSTCYALSYLFGRPIARALWLDKLEVFDKEVSKRKKELLNYMLFLRVTPFFPNTFINIACPVVGVPYTPFAIGTLLGCMPNNFVAVHTGSHLSELDSLSDLYDPKILFLGLGLGAFVLAPVAWKNWRGRREKNC